MFKNLSLKWKMIFSFVFVSSFMIVQGAVSFLAQKEISVNLSEATDINLPQILMVGDLSHALQESQGQIEILGMVRDPQKIDETLKNLKGAINEFDELDKKYSSYAMSSEEKAIYESLVADWKGWKENQEKALDILKTNSANFPSFVMGPVTDSHEKAEANLDKLIKYHQNSAKKLKENGEKAATLGNTITALAILLGLTVAAALGYISASVLSKRLAQITAELGESAQETSSAGSHLSQASQVLSSGSAEAAASLEETVASLEELSSQVKTNSEHAKEANALSQKSKESAEHGEKEIAKLIQSMSGIASGSKKIEEIISVIDDIAFQTNLLALNAAVEAARAGEQGKGFAVVAEAVRNLAQRSAVAAKDITSLIQNNVSQSEEGAKIAEVSGVVLSEIVTNVKKVSDLNHEISIASQEQAVGIEQISKAMNDLDKSTQSNAASSEEVASSSTVMLEQSSHLERLVKTLRDIVDGEKDRREIGAVFQETPRAVIPKKTAKSIPKSSPKIHKTQPAKVIQFEKKVAKGALDLESVLPLEGPAGQRKVRKVEGF